MDPQELLLTAARALAVYVLMLVVIRALATWMKECAALDPAGDEPVT